MGLLNFILVFLVVVIQIVTAILLDHASSLGREISLAASGIICLVLFINFLRFLLWGYIHKHYDISKSYPIITLFYPVIYLIALIRGDAALQMVKITAIAMIIGGLLVLHYKKGRKEG